MESSTISLKRKMKFWSLIFANRSYQGSRLGKWQSNRQREKKLNICVHPAPQSATGRMQLLGWATYLSPSARGGMPCVQNTARTNTWKELNMGMFERRKPVPKPLLLDSLCWCLGSLLNLLLMNSGFGLLPTQRDSTETGWAHWGLHGVRESQSKLFLILVCAHTIIEAVS